MLQELYEIIQDRKRNPTPESYTASLLSQGSEAIIKKVGEEAIEVLLAALAESNQRLIEESSDLLYHLLVLLAWRDVDLAAVEAELRRRRRPG